eukprot:1114626_1
MSLSTRESSYPIISNLKPEGTHWKANMIVVSDTLSVIDLDSSGMSANLNESISHCESLLKVVVMGFGLYSDVDFARTVAECIAVLKRSISRLNPESKEYNQMLCDDVYQLASNVDDWTAQ